MIKYKAT